jgi:RNA polymerase sigma factor (sigma-70 family)
MDRFPFDDDYVRRLREHDAATEEHFHDYFQPRLFNYLRPRVRSAADLHEVRQETFQRVLKQIYDDKLRDGGALPGFLFRVCENVVHEGRRKTSTEDLDDHPEPVSDEPDPEVNVITQERRRDVQRTLEAMKPFDANILRALFIEQVSRDDLRTKLGVTASYLRVLLHRAIEEFRKKYPPDE